MKMSIDLPVIDLHGKRSVTESLDAEDLGQGRYRLLYSPGLTDGLAAGDEIELTDKELCGFRVVKRSGNLCIWVFLGSEDQLTRAKDGELCRAVEALGGYLDGGTHRSLIFTIPFRAGFAAIEKTFNTLVPKIPGATWSYGNVYDPEDKPLKWWENVRVF